MLHAVVLEITGHLDLSGDISVRVTNTLTELRERAEDFYWIQVNEAPQDQIKLLHSSLSSFEDQWSGAVTLSVDLPTVCPHTVCHAALIMSQDSLTIVPVQRLNRDNT